MKTDGKEMADDTASVPKTAPDCQTVRPAERAVYVPLLCINPYPLRVFGVDACGGPTCAEAPIVKAIIHASKIFFIFD
jgi:hypothetical protein